MPKGVKKEPSTPAKKFKPATSIEAREAQMVSLAVDLAEQQLREGTASSQVITHYLKLGTARERLELEKLKMENRVLEAKEEALRSAKIHEELVQKAIDAMRRYRGYDSDDSEDI